MRAGLALAAGTALALWCGAAHAQPLANGDFDAGIEPWEDPFPDASTVISWSPIDAEEPSASGSIQVQTTVPNGAADGPWSECFPAEPGAYTLTAQVFPLSGAGQQPGAVVGFEFYEDPGCLGAQVGSPSTGTAVPDVWSPLLLEAEAPGNTTSLRVRLLVGNTSDLVPDVARFDRIQFEFVPEPGATAAGIAAALALAGLSSGARRSRRPRR